jgi:hypothetical protein
MSMLVLSLTYSATIYRNLKKNIGKRHMKNILEYMFAINVKA